ncbi:MAG: hypothetical protein NVV59_16625 [Chitinophagaceae bacterium]|nr:hypothetical protein [Chitinophagaceae bacterium]
MNNTARAPRYFSAYPLKAIENKQPASSEHQSPYLRSLLAGHKKSSTLRVYPMTNPFTEHAEPVALRRQPVEPQNSDTKEWFKNYE